MAGFATYDSSEVQVIVGGNPITGFADGTFVEIEFDEQQFNKVTGADSFTSRSKTNNYGGSITITLLATAPGNDVLNDIFHRDRRNNNGVVPILIKDASGRTRWSAQHSWIQQMPTQSFSKETEERAWILDCAELIGRIGGNDVESD